jgi:hypothetical protein
MVEAMILTVDLATFSDGMRFAENRVSWWRARNKLSNETFAQVR